MRCRLIAAGTRLPDWVNSGFRDYQRRLRAPLLLELEEIPIAMCRAGENPEPAMAREGEKMLATLGPKDHVVALEVLGASMSTQELGVWLSAKLRQAKPLAFLIGGPNGLAPLVPAGPTRAGRFRRSRCRTPSRASWSPSSCIAR